MHIPGRCIDRLFVRHYLEMLAAMVVGMLVLGVPAAAALSVAGTGSAELQRDAPALLLLGMAATMTVPMVAWMRHRDHGWAASAEMAHAMFVPTFGVIALLAIGLVDDVELLLLVQHVAMLPAMLAAMLMRRAEYSRAVHHHDRPERRVAA